MIKCLLIMHSLGGGAEVLALSLIKQLDRAKFAPSLVCVKYIPELHSLIPSDVNLFMPKNNSWLARLSFLRKLFKLSKGSLVIGSLELQSIFWAACVGPKRSIAWLHKDLGGYFKDKSRLYRFIYTKIATWAFNRCCRVVCVSQGLLKSAKQTLPALQGSENKYICINPHLDLAEIEKKSSHPLPNILLKCFARPVVLSVGRLSVEKNYPLLLKAHALLLKKGFEHNLCILGEGPQRQLLEKEARRLNITQSVFMPGHCNPFPAMKKARVYAMSSNFEGCPLVLVEALSLGLPIVSTNCPSGPGEIVFNESLGFLVPMNNPEALAQAILNAINLPNDLRCEQIARGKKRALNFSLEQIVPQWEKLLQEVNSQILTRKNI